MALQSPPLPQVPRPASALALGTIPTALVEALRDGRVVVCVGAGYTRAAGLPSWETLLRAIRDDCNLEGMSIPCETTKASYDDLDALQFEVAQRAGKARSCAVMRRLLCGKPPPHEMQERLNALFSLPLAAVITWNWDDVLDARCEILSGLEHSDDILAAKPGDGAPPLLKLQGRLDEPSTVVLDAEDYERVQAKREDFLRRLYHESDRVVLHVGMGFGREGGMASYLRGGASREHYALLSDVSAERRAELKRQGIHVIPYDSSSDHTPGLCAALSALLQGIAMPREDPEGEET